MDLSVPKSLNRKQKKLLEELAKSMGHDLEDEPEETEEPTKSKGLFNRFKQVPDK